MEIQKEEKLTNKRPKDNLKRLKDIRVKRETYKPLKNIDDSYINDQKPFNVKNIFNRKKALVDGACTNKFKDINHRTLKITPICTIMLNN